MSSKSESDTACNEARSSSDNGQRSTTEALYPPDAWNIVASTSALNTFNPIRSIVDQMKVQPNPDYEPIKLSIGEYLQYLLLLLSTVTHSVIQSPQSKHSNIHVFLY